MASILPPVLSGISGNVDDASNTNCINQGDSPDHLVNMLKKIGFIAACIELHQLRLSLDEAICKIEAEKQAEHSQTRGPETLIQP